MSVPDPSPTRKFSRRTPIIVVAITVLLIVGWSGVWLWARGQAEARLDAAASAVREAGYDLSWRSREIVGYPFRLNINLTEARMRDTSGWALEMPRLEAQAFLHAPSHWILAAPDGLTFVRPVGGPVRVTGKYIRASLTQPTATPPNLSFEAVGLTFQPAAGANPFSL
ncbi:MAG: DUF2125 domain-containing protein, partial [Phenylobacterium sp.]|nr:DUF2125 domain-containing protein [Phenylobacterium sp.]